MQQLVSGNPGTSYIACLLFALEMARKTSIPDYKQFDIFCHAVRARNSIFFTAALDDIADSYDTPLSVYCSSPRFINRAAAESSSHYVHYNTRTLSESKLLTLVQVRPIIMSTDIKCFGYSYHDYHFCCIFMQHGKVYVFEPKSGEIFLSTTQKIFDYFHSIKVNLNDIALVFALN